MDFHRNYDVVVAGAGIAGVSASLAAARQGRSVALIEKQTLIGGLATSGLIYVYLPLCDGNGRQVTFGIAEELLRYSLKYGPFDLSERWRGTPGAGLTVSCVTLRRPASRLPWTARCVKPESISGLRRWSVRLIAVMGK